MLVKVLYFAALREQLGIEQEEVMLEEGATVARLLSLLRRRGGSWALLLGADVNFGVAVNQEFAQEGHTLHADDEVGLFPPITGG